MARACVKFKKGLMLKLGHVSINSLNGSIGVCRVLDIQIQVISKEIKKGLSHHKSKLWRPLKVMVLKRQESTCSLVYNLEKKLQLKVNT